MPAATWTPSASDTPESADQLELAGSEWHVKYRGPDSIGSPIIWAKSDSLTLNNGDAVSSWDGFSQATSTYQPTYVTNQINGEPAVRFDGVDDYLQGTFASLPTGADERNLFIVGKDSRGTGYSPTLSYGGHTSGADWEHGFHYNSDNAYLGVYGHVVGCAYTAGSFSVQVVGVPSGGTSSSDIFFRIDGASQTATTLAGSAQTLNTGSSDVLLGTNIDKSVWLQGDVAEVLLYGALTTAEREGIEYYLGQKYGITIAHSNALYPTDKPHVVSAPVALSNPRDLTGFSVTYGVNNAGTWYFLLGKTVSGVTTYYRWDGAAWVAESGEVGSSASDVNANIGTFDLSDADATEIIVKAYHVSDGSQKGELAGVDISYTTNQGPSVDAGSSMMVIVGEAYRPFGGRASHAKTVPGTVSDPEFDTIAECRYLETAHDAAQPDWSSMTAISRGAHPTYQDAVRAEEITANTLGLRALWLAAKDSFGAVTYDSCLIQVVAGTDLLGTNEINAVAAAVWEQLVADHNTSGSFGEMIGTKLRTQIVADVG